MFIIVNSRFSTEHCALCVGSVAPSQHSHAWQCSRRSAHALCNGASVELMSLNVFVWIDAFLQRCSKETRCGVRVESLFGRWLLLKALHFKAQRMSEHKDSRFDNTCFAPRPADKDHQAITNTSALY
jgi:hypothetical protein